MLCYIRCIMLCYITFFFQNFKSMAVHLPLFSGLLLISLTVLNVLAWRVHYLDPLPLSIGVPQGSILGPLFFLLFINDLPLFLPQNTTLTMFPDDTLITQSISTIHELNARLNRVASGVFAWANLNDMAPNTSKTKFTLITTQQKFHRLNDRSFS